MLKTDWTDEVKRRFDGRFKAFKMPSKVFKRPSEGLSLVVLATLVILT